MLKSIGEYALGGVILILIVAWAGACAVGTAWVRDNCPEGLYQVVSPFLRNEDGFVTVGYDEFECSERVRDFQGAAEAGHPGTFLVLEDIRANCKRDYRELRKEVQDTANREGLDINQIDCGTSERVMSEALGTRDSASILVIAVLVEDNCPSEYKSYIQGLKP